MELDKKGEGYPLDLLFCKEENVYKYRSGSSPCLLMSYSGLSLTASLQ